MIIPTCACMLLQNPSVASSPGHSQFFNVNKTGRSLGTRLQNLNDESKSDSRSFRHSLLQAQCGEGPSLPEAGENGHH